MHSRSVMSGERSAGVRASVLCYLHACPICGSAETSHYCRVRSLFRAGEFIVYERCRHCDVVFRNPRLPDVDRLQKYVEKPLDEQQTEFRPLSQAHYHHMMRTVRRLLAGAPRKRLLDFGSGAGGFLFEARDAGFEVMGLEVNRALAEHVRRRYEIPVFCGQIDDPRFADEKFVAIVSSQVFEHLTDPLATLMALKTHLEPPGALLIEVPNLSDIRERLRKGSSMDDSHLFYFNRRSLSTLLRSAGFTVHAVQEGLRPYRWIGGDGRALPSILVDVWERCFSACQIKTGLSVLASLE